MDDEPITHRVVWEPKISFEDWLKTQPDVDMSMIDRGDHLGAIGLIAGSAGFPTRASTGKIRGAYKKERARINYTHELWKKYLGEVTLVKTLVELHPETNAADAAYVRVIQKRRARANAKNA